MYRASRSMRTVTVPTQAPILRQPAPVGTLTVRTSTKNCTGLFANLALHRELANRLGCRQHIQLSHALINRLPRQGIQRATTTGI